LSHAFIRILGAGRALKGQRVKARRNPRELRFISSALLAAIVIVSVLFLYIWCRLTVVSMGYEISKANMDRSALLERSRRLKIEYMELKSPQRIERIATKELGLVHPSEGQLIKVGK